LPAPVWLLQGLLILSFVGIVSAICLSSLNGASSLCSLSSLRRAWR
jgi:hypothetical protein